MKIVSYLSAFTLLSIIQSPVIAADKDNEKKNKPNHLIKESSPYLLQHAHNPVDWYPWGPDAFAKAKKEGKLVFLSIGYSSCHWCHVMEKESFSQKDVAEILNKHFVSIKVDREERPDVDKLYMTALNVLGQRGGWPLSMFMTHEGKPIIGGTYFPKEDRMIGGRQMRGFKSLLKLIIEFQKNQPKDLQKQADQLATFTARQLEGVPGKAVLFEVKSDILSSAAESLQEQFDKIDGGFGSEARDFLGTKFPTSPRLLFLHEQAKRTKSKELEKILHVTLDNMALGGIYDQLGGGFHRYSTERTWTVPHFEKMLYDNGQLMEIYALAYRLSKKELYKRIIDESIGFLDRELTAPGGAFYAALDADSEGEEGRFYVWTEEELKKALPDEQQRELIWQVYGDKEERRRIKELYSEVGGPPHFEEHYHIFTQSKPLAEHAKLLKVSVEELQKKLAPLQKKLFRIRAKRERPFRDTKILTAWNGLMIAGYAKAGEVLKNPQYLKSAERAANFILTHLRNDKGRLLRTYGSAPGEKPKAKLNGYLDDYAFLVHGLLNLHEATKENKWLKEAKALTETMVKHHHDAKRGGFFYTSDDHEEFFARAKDQYDGATPSGNSMAARNLVRLWQLTGEKKYQELAEKTFKALAIPLEQSPASVTTLTSAVGLYLDAKKK